MCTTRAPYNTDPLRTLWNQWKGPSDPGGHTHLGVCVKGRLDDPLVWRIPSWVSWSRYLLACFLLLSAFHPGPEQPWRKEPWIGVRGLGPAEPRTPWVALNGWPQSPSLRPRSLILWARPPRPQDPSPPLCKPLPALAFPVFSGSSLTQYFPSPVRIPASSRGPRPRQQGSGHRAKLRDAHGEPCPISRRTGQRLTVRPSRPISAPETCALGPGAERCQETRSRSSVSVTGPRFPVCSEIG